jgi:hypothetical protein
MVKELESNGNEIPGPDNSTSSDKMMDRIKTWFSGRAEKEIEDLGAPRYPERVLAIATLVVFSLIAAYFVAHQMRSTGFFTTEFGALEMLFLYGSLAEWMVVAALEGLGRKDLDRDIDAFGGIVFVTIGAIWLLAVFPFEFAHFADVAPDSLRFLVQWISNDVARVATVLWIAFHLASAVYYGILRVFVRKARAREII